MLLAADLAYSYSDEDKAIIRQMAREDKPGLIAALEGDELIRKTAIEHGLIESIKTFNNDSACVTGNGKL